MSNLLNTLVEAPIAPRPSWARSRSALLGMFLPGSLGAAILLYLVVAALAWLLGITGPRPPAWPSG